MRMYNLNHGYLSHDKRSCTKYFSSNIIKRIYFKKVTRQKYLKDEIWTFINVQKWKIL